MRSLLLSLVLMAAACGDDDVTPPGGDAGNGGDGGGMNPDGPPGGPDAGLLPDGAPTLGRFCSTTAVDGGIGSCSPGEVCCADGTSVCRLVDECSTGGGFVACNTTGDCPGGRICCDVSSMIFCTKPDSCDAYGGMEVP